MENYRKKLGDRGEELAADYLEKHGYAILERKYTIRGGEIDLIAKKDGTVVFAEVKTRTFDSARKYGRASEAVDKAKIRYVVRAAERYVEENQERCGECDFRFDVIEVYTPSGVLSGKSSSKAYINHICDAFESV